MKEEEMSGQVISRTEIQNELISVNGSHWTVG